MEAERFDSDVEWARKIYNRNIERFSEIQSNDMNKQMQRKVIEDILGDVRGKKVLYAGFGDGVECLASLKKGATVVGIDVSERCIELAMKNCKGYDAEFYMKDMEETGFESRSFDAIVSICSFMYKRNLESVLREMRRILKPNGELVFSTPHPVKKMVKYNDMNYFFRGQKVETSHGIERFNYHWTFGDYVNAIASAGLVIEQALEPEPSEGSCGDFGMIYPHHLIFKARRGE
jgi:ubiquinone/menaquinone biosynthesis C-methylase UbiE